MGRHPDNGIPSFDSAYWRDVGMGDRRGAGADAVALAPSAATARRRRGCRSLKGTVVALVVLLAGVAVVAGARQLRSTPTVASVAPSAAPGRVSTVTVGLRSWPIERPTCGYAGGRLHVTVDVGEVAVVASVPRHGAASLVASVGATTWRSSPDLGSPTATLERGRAVISGDAALVEGDAASAPARVPVHLDVACAAAAPAPGS